MPEGSQKSYNVQFVYETVTLGSCWFWGLTILSSMGKTTEHHVPKRDAKNMKGVKMDPKGSQYHKEIRKMRKTK